MEIGFMFVAAFIDSCTGFQEVGPLTTMDNLYYYISDCMTTDRRGKWWITGDILKIKSDIICLKKTNI